MEQAVQIKGEKLASVAKSLSIASIWSMASMTDEIRSTGCPHAKTGPWRLQRAVEVCQR